MKISKISQQNRAFCRIDKTYLILPSFYNFVGQEKLMNQFKAADFWENRLDNKRGLTGVGYAKLGPSFNYWAYKVRGKVFRRMVSRHIQPKAEAKVLDIGSGTGFYIDQWQQFGLRHISGADITRVSVEQLKLRFPQHQFFQLDIGGDIKPFLQENGHFQLVSCLDVLFHIVDDSRFQQAIHNISACLEKGGYFVYSDNFVERGTQRTTHQVSHSKKDLMQWIHKAGFEVVEQCPFMVAVNYPIDNTNPLLHAYWFVVENTLALIKPLGHVLGPVLYALDLMLTRVLKKGPSSKLIILRKK